jgi:predicted RNA polymerase sigma factor
MVRAHLLELAGDIPAARESFLAAAQWAGRVPRQRYLNTRAARLAGSQAPRRFSR